MSKKIISFVIDADIARSSGLSVHPVSSSARMLLESLRNSKHNAVMCPTLIEEWRKHRSLFASKWLSTMIAKRKITPVAPKGKIKQFIEENIEDCNEKAIALKDSHLIDAALEADRIIASNDNTARNVFCGLSTKNGEIGTVVWFNALPDGNLIFESLISNNYIPTTYYLRTEQAR